MDHNDIRRGVVTEREADEALQALLDRAPKASCPICANATWIFETEPGQNPGDWIPMPGIIGFKPIRHDKLSPTIPTLTLSCSNCGFIRQHSIPMLTRGEKYTGA